LKAERQGLLRHRLQYHRKAKIYGELLWWVCFTSRQRCVLLPNTWTFFNWCNLFEYHPWISTIAMLIT